MKTRHVCILVVCAAGCRPEPVEVIKYVEKPSSDSVMVEKIDKFKAVAIGGMTQPKVKSYLGAPDALHSHSKGEYSLPHGEFGQLQYEKSEVYCYGPFEDLKGFTGYRLYVLFAKDEWPYKEMVLKDWKIRVPSTK